MLALHWPNRGQQAAVVTSALSITANMLDCRSLNNGASQYAGRGDDVRLQHLADIARPTPYIQIGPCPALVQMAVLRGSKAATVRLQVALHCPHSCTCLPAHPI